MSFMDQPLTVGHVVWMTAIVMVLSLIVMGVRLAIYYAAKRKAAEEHHRRLAELELAEVLDEHEGDRVVDIKARLLEAIRERQEKIKRTRKKRHGSWMQAVQQMKLEIEYLRNELKRWID